MKLSRILDFKFTESAVDAALRESLPSQSDGYFTYYFNIDPQGYAKVASIKNFSSLKEMNTHLRRPSSTSFQINFGSDDKKKWATLFGSTKTIYYNFRNEKVFIKIYTDEVAYDRYLTLQSQLFEARIPRIREAFRKASTGS